MDYITFLYGLRIIQILINSRNKPKKQDKLHIWGGKNTKVVIEYFLFMRQYTKLFSLKRKSFSTFSKIAIIIIIINNEINICIKNNNSLNFYISDHVFSKDPA